MATRVRHPPDTPLSLAHHRARDAFDSPRRRLPVEHRIITYQT
ncbi:hypothetical protein F01_210208 [Burkholderia cenocepacia]|nr:hypothetical protein F01_210208 [Burkholderia cenocepacia]